MSWPNGRQFRCPAPDGEMLDAHGSSEHMSDS